MFYQTTETPRSTLCFNLVCPFDYFIGTILYEFTCDIIGHLSIYSPFYAPSSASIFLNIKLL